MSNAPKMAALEELAKAMASLKLDKLKGYKKTPVIGQDEEADVEPEADELDPHAEEEDGDRPLPFADDEESPEEDGDSPKGFSQVLEAIAKKKAHKH